MTKQLFYRRYLPFDLLETFQRHDPEFVKHLIGEEPVILAEKLGCELRLFTGNLDMNSQLVDVGIQISGSDKYVTWWLLNYKTKWLK